MVSTRNDEVSVTPQATTISISNYITKTFEKYTKTLVHFHRWSSSPPQYIFLDLHGTVRHPSLINVGYLIVYGLKETVSNVDPSVYDTAFVIENGQMVMQTDLSLNGHLLYYHSPHKRFFEFEKRRQQICFKWRRNNFIAGWSNFEKHWYILYAPYKPPFGFWCQYT